MPLHVPAPPPSASQIAELSAAEVWAFKQRLLTSLATPDDIVKFLGKGTGTEVPDDKSLYDLIALDRLDHPTYGLNALRTLIATIPTAVWTHATRTLTVAMGLVQTEEAVGTLTADGSEQDLVNTSGRGKYEGWIDLANMQAGDTVVIREYIRLKSGGSWRLYATTTYTDAQTEPAIHATRKLSEYGWRVTLQQTAGAMRTYDYEFLKEAQA